MRGIHVRPFEAVSFGKFMNKQSVEINFGPSFVVAKGAMTEIWGTGSGGLAIVGMRRHPPGGAEESMTFKDDQSLVIGPHITSVTFGHTARADPHMAVRVVSVGEVQFW